MIPEPVLFLTYLIVLPPYGKSGLHKIITETRGPLGKDLRKLSTWQSLKQIVKLQVSLVGLTISRWITIINSDRVFVMELLEGFRTGCLS